MHSLTTTLLRDIQDKATENTLSHPRDLRAAAVAYYRHFTAYLTGTEPEYDRISRAAERVLDEWEAICSDYYASFPDNTPEDKIQAECQTSFTELVNYLNEAPTTPVKFRKFLAAQDFSKLKNESFLPDLPPSTDEAETVAAAEDDLISETAADTDLAAEEATGLHDGIPADLHPDLDEDPGEEARKDEAPDAGDKAEAEASDATAAPSDPQLTPALPPPPPLLKASQPLGATKPVDTPKAKEKPAPATEQAAARPAAASNLVYRLRLSLEGADENIWRRVYVPASTELAQLHELIQLLFDWNGEQPHRFKVNYDYFGPANPDGMDQRELYDGITLDSIYTSGTNKLRYTYDFADKWEHLVLIEKTLPYDVGVTYPLCANGTGKAPLDGSGGMVTYVALVEALADPQHPKHDLAGDVLGRDWEPEYFDANEVNDLLRKRYKH